MIFNTSHESHLFSLLSRLGLREARGPLSDGSRFYRVGSQMRVSYSFTSIVNSPTSGGGDYEFKIFDET